LTHQPYYVLNLFLHSTARQLGVRELEAEFTGCDVFDESGTLIHSLIDRQEHPCAAVTDLQTRFIDVYTSLCSSKTRLYRNLVADHKETARATNKECCRTGVLTEEQQ
jgi:hypothetical protein